MKTRTMVWIGVTVVLCLTSFSLGWMKPSRELDATNFIDLMADKALLDHLRANDTTNAIAKLELLQEVNILRIMSYEPSLRGKKRYVLDKVLVDIANDRAQYRKPIMSSTNEPADEEQGIEDDPYLQQIRREWAEKETRIDAFLNNIAKQPRG